MFLMSPSIHLKRFSFEIKDNLFPVLLTKSKKETFKENGSVASLVLISSINFADSRPNRPYCLCSDAVPGAAPLPEISEKDTQRSGIS